ncbi:beta-lactamase/transpeptidase-like protein [Mytilinidion resinicola]|uniref:Beta-lactamase/transpeptidase-like protein n=1 Tax=Mytilinidion resinicola TaxID=574789 RepID=A0A6A6YGC9_9PEZI|nr:beta-lactamase/transpeptidase-like protein [Mytilinidion resinicola]KAF2807649.1 beta-lactamase/transpeptidase-like protein [Mytilinidion resinicola]
MDELPLKSFETERRARYLNAVSAARILALMLGFTIMPPTDPSPRMKNFSSKFAALSSIVTHICNLSGIPGVSIGILHHDEVVYQASFGYADVENKVHCDSDTTYVLGSLSKAFTAALLSSLVDENALGWDTLLKDVLTDFHRSDVYGDITIADLLTHRTGLAALDSLWLASDNIPFLKRSEAISILNHAPAVRPFRADFLYNNFAYEVLSQVIENRTGTTFSEALHKRLLNPLSMSRTYYTSDTMENEASPYAALTNTSVVRIPPAIKGKDNPSGRSENPIKNILKLWRGQMPLPSRSLREHSYAFGWARAQLPAILAPGDNGKSELSPVVGTGAPSRLALYHGGSIPGYNTYNALFPETGSAVIVLTNSLSLNGGVRWIGELLIEALFDNLENAVDYGDLARKSAKSTIDEVADLNKKLSDGQTVSKPTRSLDSYVGRYCNAAGNFFVDINHNEKEETLFVSYMGRSADTFQLVTYKEDSFSWSLTYDELVERARYTVDPIDYHIIKFEADKTGSNIQCLWWRHDSELKEPGEAFYKRQEESQTMDENQEL